MTELWEAQRNALGAFIREQRKRANLSLRQLAQMTSLSNPYLSQVERGLHQPSVRVLKAISDALNVSAETLLAQAGLIDAMAAAPAAANEAPANEAPANEAPANEAAANVAAAGVGEQPRDLPGTEDAIRADPRLGEEQKAALIAVYRSMLGPGTA